MASPLTLVMKLFPYKSDLIAFLAPFVDTESKFVLLVWFS